MGGLIYFIVWIVLFIAPFVAFIDAYGRTRETFQAASQSRTNWLVALGVSAIFCGLIGSGLGIYYFVAMKPKLVTAEQS